MGVINQLITGTILNRYLEYYGILRIYEWGFICNMILCILYIYIYILYYIYYIIYIIYIMYIHIMYIYNVY